MLYLQINSLRDQIELEMKRKAYTSQSDLANLSGSVQNLSYSGLGAGADKSGLTGGADVTHGMSTGLDYTPTRLTPRARSPFKR